MKKLLVFLLLFVILAGPAQAIEIVRQKNVSTYVVFPIVDADGDFTTGCTCDTEIDPFGDGAAPDGFADATNEATEIGATGWYYLLLTQAEMNNDYIPIQTKVSVCTAKPQGLLIRTIVGDPLLYATTDDGGTINVTGGAVDTVTTTTTATTATTCTTCTSVTNGVTLADGAITAAKVATDAIGADEITESAFATAIWDAATVTYGGAGSYGLLLETDLDATMSSRAPSSTALLNTTWTDAKAGYLDEAISGIDDNPWDAVARTTTGGTIDTATTCTTAITCTSVTNDVNVADADVAGAVWNAATASYGSAGSYGLLLETNLDAAVSSRGTSTLSASDNIGINWADITNPTTAQGLSGTTLGMCSVCTDVINDVNLLDVTETQIDNIETLIQRLP